MSVSRRPNLGDRRRLVIYSQRFNEDDQAVARRATVRLDEARKNVSAYGSRVQRRLRARWYGLVPVKRRTMMGVAGVLLALVALLGTLHWAALYLPQIAHYPEVARPLRLDRADSFGTWLGSMLLLITAGVSFLVYQLRRYSTNDYHGHYRIWRLVIAISVIASLDCVTGLTAWLGGTVDVLLAERDFLAGADWVRLLIGFGGAALGLRMLGEVSRNLTSLAVIGGALLLSAIPLAVRWNVLRFSPETESLWVPIAALTARAGLLIGTTVYLRMLYREVRKLEDKDRLGERLRLWLPKRRSREQIAEAKAEKAARKQAAIDAAAKLKADKLAAKEQAQAEANERAAAKKADAERAAAEKAEAKAAAKEAVKEAKAAKASPEPAPSAPENKPLVSSNQAPARSAPESARAEQDDDGDEGANDDSVDWDNLNKSERRRMRKLQKRQDKAA